MSEQLPLQGSQQQQRILVNNPQIHDINIFNQQIQQQRHPPIQYPRQSAYQPQGKQMSNVLLQTPHANNNSNGNDKYVNSYNNNMGYLNTANYPPAYPQQPLQLSGQGYSVNNPASILHMAHQQQSQSQNPAGQQKFQQYQQIQVQQQQQQQNNMNGSQNSANNGMISTNYQKKNDTQPILDQQQPQYQHLMKDTAACKQNYSCEICKKNLCELCSDHDSTHTIVSLERLFEYSFNQFESQQKDYLNSLSIVKTVEQSLQKFATKIKEFVDDSYFNYRISELMSKHEWTAAGNLFRSNYTSSNNSNNSIINHGSNNNNNNNDGNALFVLKGEGKKLNDFEKQFDIENETSQSFLGYIKQLLVSNISSAVCQQPFISNPLILLAKQNNSSNEKQCASNQPQKQSLSHLFEPQNFQLQLGLKQNQQNSTKQSAVIPGGQRTQPPRNGSSSSQNATSIQNLGSSGNIIEQSSTHTNINNISSNSAQQPIQYFLLQGNKALQNSNNNNPQLSQQPQSSQQQQQQQSQSSTSLQLLSSSQQFQQQQSSQNNCNTSSINTSNLNLGYQQSSSSKQPQQQQVTQSQQLQQPIAQRRPVYILQQNGQNGFMKTASNSSSNNNNNNNSFQLNHVGSIMNNMNPSSSNEGKLTHSYDNNSLNSTNAQANNNNQMDYNTQQDGSLIIIDQGPTKKQQLNSSNNSNTNPYASAGSLNLSNNNNSCSTNNSGTILKTREEIYNNFLGAKSLNTNTNNNNNNNEGRSFIISDTPKSSSQAHHPSNPFHHNRQHLLHNSNSGIISHSNNVLDESTLQNQLQQMKTQNKKKRLPKELRDKVKSEYFGNKKTIKELSQHFGILEATISLWIKQEKKNREKKEKDSAVLISNSNGSMNSMNVNVNPLNSNGLSQQSLSDYVTGQKNGSYYSPQVVEKCPQGSRANYNKKISELQSSSSFRKHTENSNKNIYQQQQLLAQSQQALNGSNGISLEEEQEEEEEDDDRHMVKKEYGTNGVSILGMEEEDSPIDEGIPDRAQQEKRGIGNAVKYEEYGYQDNYESEGEEEQSENNEKDKMEEDYHESLDSNENNNGSNSITNNDNGAAIKDAQNLKDDSQAIIQTQSAPILENCVATEKAVIANDFEQSSLEFKTEYVDSNQFAQNHEQLSPLQPQNLQQHDKDRAREETTALSSSQQQQQEQNCHNKENQDVNDASHQIIKEKPVILVNETEPSVGNQLQQEEEQLAAASLVAQNNNVQMKLVCFPLLDNQNSYSQYTVGCSILAQSQSDTVCVKGFQNEEWNVLSKYKFNSPVIELKYVQAEHIQRTYLIVQLKDGSLYSWNWQGYREKTESQSQTTNSNDPGDAQPFVLSKNAVKFDAFYFKKQIIVVVQSPEQIVSFFAVQLRVNTFPNPADSTETTENNSNNNQNRQNTQDKHFLANNINRLRANSKLSLGVKKQSKRKDSLSDDTEEEDDEEEDDSEQSEEQGIKQSERQTDNTQNNNNQLPQQQEQLIKLESLTTELSVPNTSVNNLIAWGQEATSCIYLCINSGNLLTAYCAKLEANELNPNHPNSSSTTSSLKLLYSTISEDMLSILRLRLHKNTRSQQEVIGASETGFLYVFDLVKLNQQYFKTKFQRGESMRDMQVFNSNEEKSEEVRVILCYDDFLRIRRHKKLQFQQGMRCATLSLSEQEITVYYILNQHDTIMKHTISLQP